MINENSESRQCGTTPPRSALAYLPRVPNIDWAAVLNDTRIPIVFVNSAARALALCVDGVPAIAVFGLSRAELAAWLSAQGANEIAKAGVH